jgi:hypothetical protein
MSRRNEPSVPARCAAVNYGDPREDYLAAPDELLGSAILEAAVSSIRPGECVQPEVASTRRRCDHAREKTFNEPTYGGLHA